MDQDATELSPHIAAFLAELGSGVVEARTILGLPSNRGHATWRVALADGRVVKVRQFPDGSEVNRFEEALRAQPDGVFPALLGHRGPVTIEAWISGISLDREPFGPGLEEAARILARIHRTECDAAGSESTEPLLDRIARELEDLVARDWVRPREVQHLAARARSNAPAIAAYGWTHNDLCAENLVLETGTQRLVSIDNERLGRGFFDFDLARTRYRWPLRGESWRRFLAVYAEHRDPSIEAHAEFWEIAALVRSAHVRAVKRAVSAELPIRELRRLIGRS